MKETKPLTKRQQRSLQTRENIYNTAMELINRYGYENVTINDICEKASVSVGTFYHQFSSKDEILISCLESEDLIISRLVLPEGSHSLRFKELFMTRNKLGTTAKTPELGVFSTIAHLKNGVTASFSIDRKIYQALLNEVIEGQKEDEFKKSVDPDFFVETALYHIAGLMYAWQISGGTIDIEEKANKAVDFLLDTILVKP